MKPGNQIILRFLIMLAIALAGYVVVCLAMGRTPAGQAMVLTTVVLSTSLVFGWWYQTWIRRKAVADHMRCGACGYNLTGHKAVIGEPRVRCPECGEPLQEASVVKEGQPHPVVIRRSQRRLSLLASATGLLAFSALAAMMIYQGKRGGELWMMIAAIAFMAFWLALTCWKPRRV